MFSEHLINALQENGFHVSVFPKKEDAAAYLTGRIVDETVAFGGSVSAKELGLYESLAAKNTCISHWHKTEGDPLRKARSATVYISSVNALAESGEMVNIDGTCNRLASTLYGPQALYLIIGENKLARDLPAAIDRARNVAAPKNAARLGRKTPCVTAGKCCDCKSPERICRAMTVYWKRPGGIPYAEVILVEEALGL